MPDMKEARLLGTPVPSHRHAPRSSSPLKHTSRLASPSDRSASPTLSTTSRGAPSPSPAPPPAHQQQPSAAELKAKAAAAVARTCIVADPSIASAFRREDDNELWELFTR